jgi:serine protease Do
MRDGRKISIDVTLSDRAKERLASDREQPDEKESAETTSPGRIGVSVGELSRDVIRRYRLPENLRSGVMVLSVKPSSNAYEEGLRPGMIITEVNGSRITDLADFRSAIEELGSGDYVRFYIVVYFRGEESGRFIVFQVD